MEVSGLSVGYAFGAGLLAAINPCGVAMLPAVVGYELGVWSGGPVRLVRGLGFGLGATAGFIGLFSAVGVIIVLGGRALIGLIPWGALAVGVGLVLLGLLSLGGRGPHLLALSRVGLPAGGFLGPFGVGVAYGIASLSCALPIFLVVVGSALTVGGPVGGLLMFAAYGAGMGVMLTAVSVAAALFKDAALGALRPAARYFERLGAVLLLGAGAYIVYFWAPAVFGG